MHGSAAREVCDEGERVTGGYVLHGVRFPYGSYADNGVVVCTTWAAVVALLAKVAGEEEVSALAS